jgi:prevent-host-death family protein
MPWLAASCAVEGLAFAVFWSRNSTQHADRIDLVAICGYICGMKTVSIRDAKNRLTELAREVERGETVVVTRNGRPAFDLVPHQKRKGLRLEAIDQFKRKHRIKVIVSYIADDFDQRLPEDFLLRPLPIDR